MATSSHQVKTTYPALLRTHLETAIDALGRHMLPMETGSAKGLDFTGLALDVRGQLIAFSERPLFDILQASPSSGLRLPASLSADIDEVTGNEIADEASCWADDWTATCMVKFATAHVALTRAKNVLGVMAYGLDLLPIEREVAVELSQSLADIHNRFTRYRTLIRNE